MSAKHSVDTEGSQGRPLVDYPLVYDFKVMGRAEGFRGHVKALFETTLGLELRDADISEQPSSGGRYVSLTVSVWLTDEEQRRNMYVALHRDTRVAYYL